MQRSPLGSATLFPNGFFPRRLLLTAMVTDVCKPSGSPATQAVWGGKNTAHARAGQGRWVHGLAGRLRGGFKSGGRDAGVDVCWVGGAQKGTHKARSPGDAF